MPVARPVSRLHVEVGVNVGMFSIVTFVGSRWSQLSIVVADIANDTTPNGLKSIARLAVAAEARNEIGESGPFIWNMVWFHT